MAYGRSRYGGTLYAGEGVEDEPPIPPTPITPSTTLSVSHPGAIGCGEWSAFVVGRGGSPVRVELGYTGLTVSRVLNTSGNLSADVPNAAISGTSCCEAFAVCEPWKDELLLYRDREVAAVGPLISVSAGNNGGQFQANDLFTWMEQRFIEENFHGDGDASDVFHALFDLGYDVDPSPNIEISTRQVGVDVTQDFKGTEFQRVADALRGLGRTGLDFTMDGRRLLVGSIDDFVGTTPLILHDEGVLSVEVSREGANFATDVAVFGATKEVGGSPVNGRAVRALELYGLVQKSFTELLIRDAISADANALARVSAMQPAPLRVKATLSDKAAFAFSDLICGRLVDVRFREAAGCIAVNEVMRLQQVDISVSAGDGGVTETIEIQLIPQGEGT